MLKAILSALLLTAALVAQTQTPPMIFRIPAQTAQLTRFDPFATGDIIEVLTQTTNPAVASVRITLVYQDAQGKPVTLVSEQQAVLSPGGRALTIHTFSVPSYQVPLVSVRQTELTVATDQTYTNLP